MPRFGGLANTWPMLGSLEETKKTKVPFTLTGISQLNHIEFQEKGIKTWRHSGIGAGIEHKHDPIPMQFEYKYKLYLSSDQPRRRPNQPFRKKNEERAIKEDENVPADQDQGIDHGVILKCATPHCTETFKSHAGLAEHNMKPYCVVHRRQIKKRRHSMSAMAYAKKRYISKFSTDLYEGLTAKERRKYVTHLQSLKLVLPHEAILRKENKFTHEFVMAFGLRTRKAGKNFENNQVQWVFERWEEGEKYNKKLSPKKAEELMKKALDPTDPNGKRKLFKIKERLSEAQIRGLFSRFTVAKNREGQKRTIRPEDHKTVTQEEEEEQIREMDMEYDNIIVQNARHALIDEKEAQDQDHPVVVRVDIKPHWLDFSI